MVNACEFVATKWLILIIHHLMMHSESRFVEIERDLGINTRTLSQRLTMLEDHGFITKHTTTTYPPHISYMLTDKAKGLTATFIELGKWYDQHK